MGIHFKYNPETGEYDLPCTWKESVIATARNRWIPEQRRKEIIRKIENMSEEEAEKLCHELDFEIEREIEYWRFFT